MVGDGKMIPHSGREFHQEESQEQGVVFVTVGGEEGQHPIHHVAGQVISWADGWACPPTQRLVAILSWRSCLQPLRGVGGVGLHTVNQVADGHYLVLGQLHQDMIVLGVGGGYYGTSERYLCFGESCSGVS